MSEFARTDTVVLLRTIQLRVVGILFGASVAQSTLRPQFAGATMFVRDRPVEKITFFTLDNTGRSDRKSYLQALARQMSPSGPSALHP